MHAFANPTRFLKLISALQPWAMWVSVLCLTTGLYFALIVSPADYQQSETVRIMYVHVPASWMAIFCYSALAVASAVGDGQREPRELERLTRRATGRLVSRRTGRRPALVPTVEVR